MAVQSSFPKVADQVILFNKNIVDILSKLNNLTVTNDSTVDIQIFDENGVLRTFSLPSFTSLKSEIDRLNNNINSLYSIDAGGSMIQTSSQNLFKKIITVNLNNEPTPLENLGIVNTFKSSPNWFFDSLLDPLLSVEFDLSGQITKDIRKCQVRRYIIEFARDVDGNLTPLGQSALNSFNDRFRGNTAIILSEFENWHATTPGLVEPLNPKFDEQVFDLEPNEVEFQGEFNVLRIQEDRLNRKLWYVLNTLDYTKLDTGEIRQLALGNEIVINSQESSTRYKVIEISLAESNPRVRFERIEGLEAIPVGIGTIRIYSPIIYTTKIRVSVGYNERNVVFMKPVNAENNIVARRWSNGTGFYTNDLRFESTGNANNITMEQFYIDYVFDYGIALQDLVAKKTPNSLAGTPNIPVINVDNFKVVQINKHLTDTPDANLIKQKHNYQISLKSELKQLDDAIIDRNKKIKITKFTNESAKKQSKLEIDDLIKKKETRSKLVASLAQEIITLSKNPLTKVEPKYRLRGFWSIPEAVVTRGTKPQEVVQFRVQYRYISKSGSETPVEQFQVDNPTSKASFSNWVEFKTDARKRIYDPSTGEYAWDIEDLESADTPNINQIDISIQKGEKVEFRIKSISEVGWPESPVESDWSEITTIEFPDDLNNILNENDFILQEASKEDIKVNISNELSAKGLDEHLSDSITINSKVYHHDSTKILSGFKDENGVSLDLFEYMKSLEERIKGLEEKIRRSKGELEVIILRNNQEFPVGNDSETIFNIECEDYLDRFSAKGAPAGRVYENSIYVIKDFVLKIRNKAQESVLGLLSSRTYLQNSDVYNKSAPQMFWVNNQDELITSDVSGQTRTQLNNQFIWMVNYDSVTQDSVNKLSENIGNLFAQSQTSLQAAKQDSNSLTDVLSSTEFTLGYAETTVLSFVGNNKSLLDPEKWIDKTVSVASTTKLLTTIHPVVKDLENIVETNSQKVKSVQGGDQNSIIIPINIYFKMNALDSNQKGNNYQYITLNNTQKTTKHIKKIKFLLENEADNRPFTFTIKFNMNRSKVIVLKTSPAQNISIK
jgi:hypothetical protein